MTRTTKANKMGISFSAEQNMKATVGASGEVPEVYM